MRSFITREQSEVFRPGRVSGGQRRNGESNRPFSSFDNPVMAAILARMKTIVLVLVVLAVQVVLADSKSSLYSIPLKDINGKDTSLKEYEGKVLLVVNVASKCGFTPQYKALEAIHRKYKNKGFTVVGFPCNDFGAQEPGTPEEIKQFC